MTPQDTNALFDDRGQLRQDLLQADAQQVLSEMKAWLVSQRRRMFLPMDLMVVLVERGHTSLTRAIAEGTEGNVLPGDVPARLRVLADEIEEERTDEAPSYERNFFSRGFTRILLEAVEQAKSRGRAQVAEDDIVRSVLWRAEALESASVRWAIRRLAEGGGDRIFDEKGLLREAIFQGPTWEILQGAMRLAASHGTPFLGTPHLVAMLCTVRNSTLWRSAKTRGFEPPRLRDEMLRLIGTRSEPIPEFLLGRKTLTPRMVRMLSFSAAQASYKEITEGHIVEGFLEDGGSSLELVQALGLESEVRRALGEPKVLEQIAPMEAVAQFNTRKRPTPTLDMLGRDLTVEALEGKLPEIVGREAELQRVLNVLLRKEQRNPLLTGEAGVGKTALAIALAQKIASGKVPRMLQGHRVVEINGANLMSGTSYRGDLESRIKGLLEEASQGVILFIDEAHAVFAPRAGSHAPAEIPNHFKSALASGDIAVVAATTEAEYRRWIEQDPALKRRFERVEIGEPSLDLVRAILGSLVEELQRDYEVEVDPAAIPSAIELSVKFIPEQRLPDKAKKLLMDACIARANAVVEAADGAAVSRRVTAEDVARQVNQKTNIPLERLLRGDIHWWVGIEDRLRQEVVGQDLAIRDVARALISGRLRSAQQARPLGVLLFAGPQGVGKGTLASALALEVFGSKGAIIRLDMTDYQEPHSMSRLIGSPPGYVGYEDEDMLVTPLRRRPSSIVLLEDFDRAHPQIQDRILRLLREGEIADTRGYKADVRNAVFILSVHVELQGGAARIGFGAEGASAQDPVKLLSQWDRQFAARVAEQVDAVVLFRELTGEGASPALDVLARRVDMFVQAMAAEYRIEVSLEAALRAELEGRASSMRDARSVEALVESMLYQTITDALLAGSCATRSELWWDADASQARVRPTRDV